MKCGRGGERGETCLNLGCLSCAPLEDTVRPQDGCGLFVARLQCECSTKLQATQRVLLLERLLNWNCSLASAVYSPV